MKTTLIAIALILAASLGACSSEEQADSKAASPDAAVEQSAAGDSASAAEQNAAPNDTQEATASQQQAEPQDQPAQQQGVFTTLDADADRNRAAEVVQAMTLPLPADAAEEAAATASSSSEMVEVEATAEAIAPEEPVMQQAEQAPAADEAPDKTAAATTPAATASLQGDVSLPAYVAEETMKSRNYPFTPQVADQPETAAGEGRDVVADFGVEIEEGKRPAVPEGVETAAVAEPAPQPETPQAPVEAETKQAVPQQTTEPAQAQKPAQKDLGVGFGAPEMPEQKASQQAEAKEPAPRPAPGPGPAPVEKAPPKTEPAQAAKNVAPQAKKPKLRKSTEDDRVLIAEVPVQPLSPDKPLSPQAPKVTQQFKDFAIYWVDKISSNYLHNEDNKQVLNEGGVFVARYTELDKGSLELLVKEKPYDHTPFVGLMKYTEYTYEARGETPEQALSGRFERVDRLGITEIFRYSEGHWIE